MFAPTLLRLHNPHRRAVRRCARLLSSEGKKTEAKPQIPKPRQHRTVYQRSHVERKPKVLLGIMGAGVSAATISTVVYYENARYANCEMSGETDSVTGVVEPITKTHFPSTLFGYETPTGNPNSVHWLVGSSVRCMLNFCSFEPARAYSYALYISQDSFEKFQGCESPETYYEALLPSRPVELESESKETPASRDSFIASKGFVGSKAGYVFKKDKQGLGYYRDLISESKIELHDFQESHYPSAVLRLVMLHDVKTEHIAHGFDKGMLPRIRQAQGNKVGSGKDTLREFTAFLRRQKKWKKGTHLEFVRTQRGFVVVRVDGKVELTLKSEIFSWALFDTYYGKKGHMNKACKESVIARTKELLTVL